MEQIYDVLYKGRPYGKVQIAQAGLYWNISCRCEPLMGEMLHLVGNVEKGIIDLGLLYPVDGKFGMDTKLPCAKTGNEIRGFELMERSRTEKVIPIDEQTPFPDLSILELCRFKKIDGKNHLILLSEKMDEKVKIVLDK